MKKTILILLAMMTVFCAKSRYSSNINHEAITSAIPTIKGDGGEDNVVYYDMTGRRMTQQPSQGIFIAKGNGVAKKILAR